MNDVEFKVVDKEAALHGRGKYHNLCEAIMQLADDKAISVQCDNDKQANILRSNVGRILKSAGCRCCMTRNADKTQMIFSERRPIRSSNDRSNGLLRAAIS